MTPTAEQPRMTEERFNEVVSRTRLTKEKRDMCRRVLIDGLTRSEAAQESGVTRQNVQQAIARILQADADVPPGWVRVEAWLPPAMAAQVRTMAAQAQANRRAGQDD